MKSHYLFLFPAVIMLASCAPRHTITADIEGWGNTPVVIVHGDMIKMMEPKAGNVVFDTLVPVAGRFVYDIATEGPARVQIISKSQIDTEQKRMSESSSINLILQPGEKARIKGRQFADHLEYTVRGSAGNEQWARHAESLHPYTIVYDSVDTEIGKAMFRQGWQGKSAETMMPVRDSLRRGIMQLRRNYITSHPDSWLSVVYLLDAVGSDSTMVYLDRLSPSVREGSFKPLLDKRYEDYLEYQAWLEQQKVIKEGAAAPAFTLADREGKATSLADIAAEYVVLDFWGSWCGPCIAGFPRMKEYHAKYHNRIEFVGIACNDSHDDWIAALDKHTPGWTQLIDAPEEKMQVKYGVGAFPTKIILGPAGNGDSSGRKIVHIFVGEGEDFYKALDELSRP